MRCGTRENEKEKSCEKSFLKLCRAIARSFQRKDDRDRQNDDENYDGQFVHVYKMKKKRSHSKKNSWKTQLKHFKTVNNNVNFFYFFYYQHGWRFYASSSKFFFARRVAPTSSHEGASSSSSIYVHLGNFQAVRRAGLAQTFQRRPSRRPQRTRRRRQHPSHERLPARQTSRREIRRKRFHRRHRQVVENFPASRGNACTSLFRQRILADFHAAKDRRLQIQVERAIVVRGSLCPSRRSRMLAV